MKQMTVALFATIVLLTATGSWAVNKAEISENVSSVAAAINNGKAAGTFKADTFTPYVFILEKEGKLLVHPSLAGESLKVKAPPVYAALAKATPEGVWVQYKWKGKTKNTYAKMTKNNLIVGSGY